MIECGTRGDRLRDLHQEYAERVNLAVAEGRDDIVAALVDEYPDAALRLMAAPTRE